ncbi:MAG: hypothetical protein HBSAPP03_19310 [Phycisphaerae bacterium]|nr:MAG: hypothetical protein HBSAPP03_19310 [Phycisphaerae bacterium]
MVVRRFILAACLTVSAANAHQPEARLDALAVAHPEVVSLFTFGTSGDGVPLRGARLAAAGEGPTPEDRPAIVIVAGLNPLHRVGMDTALGLIDELASNQHEFLSKRCVYVIPCANPDGFSRVERASPRMDWPRTPHTGDADHDARRGEDPAEDLNGDGFITMMRLKDPSPTTGLAAEFMLDPADGRILKRPDTAKGERAQYALLIEGVDNDGDGKFNEDGPGGAGDIDPSTNFPYRWPEFADGAGDHALCLPETRALAEWFIEKRNIAAVLVFGPGDTLINVPPTGRFDASGQVPLGIEEGDKAAYDAVSAAFKEATKMNAATALDNAGSLQGWVYAHLGILSFQTPVWVRPDQIAKADEARPAETPPANEPTPAETPAADDPRARLRAFQNATPAERERMMAEFEAMPAAERERIMAAVRGGQPGGQPGAGAPPSGGPPAGGPPGGGRRGGGRGPGRGGSAPGGGASAGPTAAPATDDEAWLKYDAERVAAGDESGFILWTPFTHPQLGEIEIGGWKPGFKHNPPADELPRLVAEQTAFLKSLSTKFPNLTPQGPWVERLGPSLWRITVRVVNEGTQPSMPSLAVKARRTTPTLVTIGVPIERIISGEKIARHWAIAGSGGVAETSWVITGAEGSTAPISVRPSLGAPVTLNARLDGGAK